MKKKYPHSVSIVVPVFNGEKTVIREISDVLTILKKNVKTYEILVGDDVSRDNTRHMLQKTFSKNPHVRLLFNKKNLGIGGNVLNLYKHAKNDFILFYVADGDWVVSNVEKLLQKQRASNADIVIGKRLKKGGYTQYRKIISFFHNFLPILFFGINTVDAGSLKIYNRKMFHRLNLISKSEFTDAEIIIRARKIGYRFTTVPIRYQKPHTNSGSAGNPALIIRSTRDLFRVWLDLFSSHFTSLT
jgi:glycosyltransferase involved in cell wall biosynthesis